MDWLKEFQYFNISKIIDNNINKVIFTPKKIIHDIYFNTTKHIIPYTNGKCYFVYQDITFKILEFLEKNNYDNLTVQLNNNNNNIPDIIISSKSQQDDSIITNINKIMTKYINRNFSLFIDQ